MEPQPATGTAPSLPATLRLGPSHLIVRDLDRSIGWYESALGLQLHRREDGEAELGDGAEPVIVLHEDPEARPAGRHSGLFHYALLYPSREELARAAVRLSATGTPVQGASDHGTHEAIYLPDPDGNGIELAADRPREEWGNGIQRELDRGGPQPLDVQNLLSTVADEPPTERVAPGLRTGHLHLHVGNLEQALAFYRDVLGFEVQAMMSSAAFVSAGGYHHHLGLNTWRGEGAGPPPEHTAGLEHWTIVLDEPAAVAEVRSRVVGAGLPVDDDGGGFTVRDPWEAAVRFEVAR